MKNSSMEKRYGLFTAICMVVGIVIGSGVFFKAQDILNYTSGNMLYGILAWVIGGVVMIVCAFTFANLATKYSKVNGLIDFAEAVVGKRYAYFVGWFISTIYYPAMTSVLAWVSARYTLVLFDANADVTGGLCIALGTLYLCLAYTVNVLAPKIAGKFQVSTTFVKLVPLAITIVVGTVAGLINGNTVEAFTNTATKQNADFSSVFSGIAAAAFAYEGWAIATSINAELKNPKKNMPIALVIGTLVIMFVYIAYFIGLTGGATVEVLQSQGSTVAFTNLFGNIGGTVLNVFIVVSCLGTLNGLMLANTRSIYSVALMGRGPKPQVFAQLDEQTNMPVNGGALSLLFCAIWFFYFYASNLTEPIFGVFSFDSSELPIITVYAIYIPIFIMFIVKEGKNHTFKNIIMPIFAIICSLFMVFIAIYAHGIKFYNEAIKAGKFSFPVLFYLIAFAVITCIGMLFYKQRTPRKKK